MSSSSLTCPVQVSFRDLPPDHLYEPSSLVEYLAEKLPRFLNSEATVEGWMRAKHHDYHYDDDQYNDLDDFDTPSSTNKYWINLSTISVMVSVILLVWGWFLVVLWKCGYDHVGLWSGGGGSTSTTSRRKPSRTTNNITPTNNTNVIPTNNTTNNNPIVAITTRTSPVDPPLELPNVLSESSNLLNVSLPSSSSTSSSSLATHKRSNYQPPSQSQQQQQKQPLSYSHQPYNRVLLSSLGNEDNDEDTTTTNNNNNNKTHVNPNQDSDDDQSSNITKSTSWILDLIQSRPTPRYETNGDNNDEPEHGATAVNGTNAGADADTLGHPIDAVSSSQSRRSASSSSSSSSSSVSSATTAMSTPSVSELTTTFLWEAIYGPSGLPGPRTLKDNREDKGDTNATFSTDHDPQPNPNSTDEPNNGDDYVLTPPVLPIPLQQPSPTSRTITTTIKENKDDGSVDSADRLLDQILMDDDKDQFIDDDDSNYIGDNGTVDVDQNTTTDDNAPASSSSPLPSSSDPLEEAVSSSSFSELMPPPSQHDYYALSPHASSPTLLRSLPKDLNTSFPIALDETVVVGADLEDIDEEDEVDSGKVPEPLPNNGLVTKPPSTTATIKPTHRPPRPLRITHYHKSRTASGPPSASHSPSKPPLHPQQQLVRTNPAPLLVTDDPTLLVDVSGLVIHSTNEMDTTATSTSVFNDSILVDLVVVPGTSDGPLVAAGTPTAKVTSVPKPWTSPIAPQLLAELSLAESVSSGLLTDDDDDSTNDDQQLMTTTFHDTENNSFLLEDSDDNNDNEETDSPPARIPMENGHGVDTTPPSSDVNVTATHTPSNVIVQIQDIDGVLKMVARQDCHHPVAAEEDKDNTTTATLTTPINKKNEYPDLEGRPSRDTQSTHPMDGRSDSSSVSSSLVSHGHDDDDDDDNDSFVDHPNVSHEQMRQWQQYESDLVRWQGEHRTVLNRLNRWKCLVVICCTLLIGTTILGAVNGAGTLNAQRLVMIQRWNNLQTSAWQVQRQILDLVDLQSTLVENHLADLWPLLDQHCPRIQNHLCVGIRDTENNDNGDDDATIAAVSCNVTGIPLQDHWQAWLDVYGNPTKVESTLDQSRFWESMISEAQAFIEMPVESALEGWNWALWATIACNMLLSIFCLNIIVAIASDKMTRLRHHLASWRLAIIYWVTVVLTWIFGMCFWVGTVLTVDTCIAVDKATGRQGPYNIARLLLDRNLGQVDGQTGENTPPSILRDFWNYHMEGCLSENYPGFLNKGIETLGEYMPVTARLASRLATYSELEFLQVCGTSLGPLRAAVATVNLQLCIVTESLDSVRQGLRCDEWYPWYDSMVNDAVCEQSTNAFVWSSACQMAVLFLAFLIWTFRASFTMLAKPIPTKKMPFSPRIHDRELV